MNKSILTIILIALIGGMTGCQVVIRKTPETPSKIWENLSLGEIVQENTGFLLPGPRELFGMESGTSAPFHQKREEMVLEIESASLPVFLEGIQSGIEEAITANGADLTGRGSGGVTGTFFEIEYRQRDIFGAIQVWGMRGTGTSYVLVLMITEG